MSIARALAWNTAVQLIGKVVSTALGVIIIGLMTRLLGAEGFGYYTTATAYFQVFVIMLDLGLNVTLVALLGEHAGDEAYEKRCVSALFTLRLFLSIVLILIIAPAVAWALPYPPELKLAIIALTGAFFFPALNQVVVGVQQRHLRMHFAALGEVLGRVILLVGLLIARAQGWGLLPIVWLVSLAAIGNFLLAFFATRRVGDFRWNWDPAFWKTTLKRSWPIGVSIAFNLIYYKADTLVLSWYRPQAEVGVYGAAYRVLEILITLPYMYIGVLLPILTRAWATKNREQFAQYLGRSFDVMILFVAPLVTGIWLLGPQVMSAVAGPDFALSGDVLKILALAIGVIYLNVVYAHAVVAVDAQKKMLPIYIVVALVTLAGYVAFIPTFGMWAAAWLTVLSELAVGLGSLTVTKMRTPLGLKPRATLVAIAASAVMALIVSSLAAFPLYVTVPAGALVYLGAIYALGGIPKSLIKEMLSPRKEEVPIKPAI